MKAVRKIHALGTWRPIGVAAVLALSLLLSCRKDDEPTGTAEVSFLPRGIALEDQTKAAVTTSLDATGFYASAVTGSAGSDVNAWSNVQFHKSGDDFKGGKYWPQSDPSYRFYAANRPLTYGSGGATISASNDLDVVCAYKSNPTYGTRNTLQFDHIFARISTVTVSATAPYNISAITIWIVNPKTGGTYNLYTGSGRIDGTGWSSLTPSSSTQTQLFSNAGTITAGDSSTGVNNDLYIVPGTYQLKATWTASVDDYSQTYTTKTSVSNVFIQGGKVNSISVSLSGDATEITFSIAVADWGSNPINAGTFPVAFMEPAFRPVEGLSPLRWPGVPLVCESADMGDFGAFGC